MKHKKYIAILGGGLLQVPFLKRASQDYKIILIDENPNAPGKSYAKIFFNIPFHETHKIARQLFPYREDLLNVVTIATDFSLEASLICEDLEIATISPKIGQITTNKEKMRIFFQDHGYIQPSFLASDNLNDLYLFIEESAPSIKEKGFVIKPVRNMGARGVQFIEDSTHLLYAFEYAQKFSRNKKVILEEYIDTQELSIDALCYDGKVILTGIADREIELVRNRYFIERGHDMPSENYDALHPHIESFFQKICDDFSKFQGFAYHGALKGDIKLPLDNDLHSENFMIGEIASRLSGGYMSTHTYPAAFHANLMDLYLKLLEKDKLVLNAPQKNISYSCEINFEAEPGKLKSITEKKMIDSIDNSVVIKEIEYPFRSGDLIYPLRNNVGKAAHIVLEAETRKKLTKNKERIRKNFHIETEFPKITAEKINRQARKQIPQEICTACDVCDGKNCASNVPGMGGRGDNLSFYSNYRDLQKIEIIIKKSDDEKDSPIDVSSNFLDRSISFPVMTAPITGSITNLGGAITEWEMAEEITLGAKQIDTFAFLGDGATPNKFYIALKNQRLHGNTIPIFKPRKNQDEIKFRIEEGIKHGIHAWGMDIDSAGLITMENKHQKTSKKSSNELTELSKFAKIPFIVKGVLTVEDAQKAVDANAYAIVISNHGGRVDDHLPSSISQLKKINEYIRMRKPEMKILIDGGFRTGSDIFRALALGADFVLIGRPIAIAAVAFGRFGVYSVLTNLKNELISIMKKLHIPSIREIKNHHVDANKLYY